MRVRVRVRVRVYVWRWTCAQVSPGLVGWARVTAKGSKRGAPI